MPEATVTTESGGRTVTTKWWSNYLTPQTLIWIMAAFVSVVIFWKDSKDNWDKIGTKANESEVISLREQLKDLEDKVNRQYSRAAEDRDKEGKQIEEALDWIEWKKGYEQAQRDSKK